jgi:glutamate/tyrosine decarboxylase-like PLP-dependent enzyme
MTTQAKNTVQEKMFAQMRDKSFLEQAKSYACAYLDEIYDRSVIPTGEAVDRLKRFDAPMPQQPADPQEILRELHETGSPATVAEMGGRYFGFVIGSSVPAAVGAHWLADAWDQNGASWVMSPVNAQLESVCEKWIVELLGLPQGTAAGFVSGSTQAGMCGLAAGRNALLTRMGWDVNANGLFGAPPVRVIVGEHVHAAISKALGLLGLGSSRVEVVPVDNQGRMIAGRMPMLDSTCLVLTQAGNVNSGAFDPIDEICALAHQAGAWVHVDGAFGLWAAVSQSTQHLSKGIEMADSWSVDAHKLLNSPYDCGIVLCRDRQALVSAMYFTGAYLIDSERRDSMHYAAEMSRRARGIELWATLKALGSDGLEELIERLCSHARRFGEKLAGNGFHILNDIVFNQVLVTADTPEQTRAVLDAVQKSGECWCGGTVWFGQPAIRISVCSWATTADDVDRSVAAFVNARELVRRTG